MSDYHVPVLLSQSIELLAINPGGRYVDVTFGGGGHSRAILERLGPSGRLVAFDRDPDARANLPADERIRLIAEDFKFFDREMKAIEAQPFDGILADLGVSSHQFDDPKRGFSYRFDAPLDMRMDPGAGQTAADLINRAEAAELQHIFGTYGEVRNARKLANTIVEARAKQAIRTSRELEDAIKDCMPPRRQAKYLSQVYQALRIKVNGEMEALEALLMASISWLNPGGRLVVIAYHSLEDRMVKNFFRSGNLEGIQHKDFYGQVQTPWRVITRKAVQAPESEIAVNPRARSARLRAAERLPS